MLLVPGQLMKLVFACIVREFRGMWNCLLLGKWPWERMEQLHHVTVLTEANLLELGFGLVCQLLIYKMFMIYEVCSVLSQLQCTKWPST